MANIETSALDYKKHYPKTFRTDRSERYSREIAEVIPGGVDSPFRSFLEVGGETIFFSSALGSRLFDLDGNCYIDYLGAWGPAILGHCPKEVVSACQHVIANGPIFGAPHELELEMARSVISAVPSVEKIRFVNSGTEAVMSAIRLARGYTGKNVIVMFEGGYHGHSDPVLASRGHSASAGIPHISAQQTVLAHFNDADSVKLRLQENRGDVAAVIMEPICGSMGVIPPEPGFLEQVRKLCTEARALLIFDEVLTGFRVAFGGAQVLYGIEPDLTTFGKALGGGMAIGAYGGPAEIMDKLQPEGNVYQAGTFSGNPITMRGGVETLKLLSDPQVYRILENRTAQLFEGLSKVIERRSLPIQLQRVGSMFAIIFAERPVRNYQDSTSIDTKAFAAFFHYLLSRGIYLPPSAVDAACLSAAHSEQEIEDTVRICSDAFSAIF